MEASGQFGERVLEIEARLDRLHEVRGFAEQAGRDFGFGDSEIYDLRLALTEAVSNAVRHGSESTADRIQVRASEDAGALVFVVQDSGTFVPRMKVPRDLPESGRGMAFMGELMDEVEVRPTPEGTAVRLSKRPSS